MSRILVGGFTHIVPMVVDACVEEIYRTGVYQRDLFHTLPNRERLLQLVSTFDNGSPPRRPSGPPDASTSKGTLYAIPPSMEKELTPNVCALLVTYLSALPDTIIHRSLSDALWAWCVSPSLIRQQERSRRRGDDDASESEQEASDEEDENAPSFNTRLRLMELERENLPPFKIQILIAQHVLLLLPPRHFSLLIHLMTFFATLQLCPENGVGLEDIGRIFGPTIVGGKVRKRNKRDDEKDIERAVKGEKDEKEKKIMVWLVSHWERIAQAYEMEDPEMVRRRSQVGSMRREASRSSERGWSAGRAVDKKRPSSDEDSRDERRPSTVESLTSGTTASTSDFSEDDVPVISPSQFRSALGSETKEGDHRLDAMTGDEDRSQPVNEDLPAYDSHASSKYRGSSRDFTLPDIGTDPSTGELSSSVRQFFLENDETGGHPTDLGEPNLAHHSGKANSTPSVIPHDRSHTSADITRGLSASIPAPRRTSRLAEDARLATQFVLQRENAELRRQLDKALSERDEARGLMATMRSILDATSK
ncbi:hypothetical protein EW026_g6926 [Hermanssonia centrifuga]|uniref:Rho-GAP domain-containing protein n=1 Tax=Hermanssonia centrifuga TaxID=98765 RepID=A0A4S4K9N0_9APHY|nr:hypothetical protein EW026_g6926 [Hermanssonia centrifuga]